MYENVLIVDDSSMDRRLSELVIERSLFAGQITSCSSVLEGLCYLQSLIESPEQLPSVIFLDVNMPILDGFDFLDNFLKFPYYVQQHCAVFMLSATNSPDELERIKTYPVVRKFYRKPLNVGILDNIHEHIEKQKV